MLASLCVRRCVCACPKKHFMCSCVEIFPLLSKFCVGSHCIMWAEARGKTINRAGLGPSSLYRHPPPLSTTSLFLFRSLSLAYCRGKKMGNADLTFPKGITRCKCFQKAQTSFFFLPSPFPPKSRLSDLDSLASHCRLLPGGFLEVFPTCRAACFQSFKSLTQVTCVGSYHPQ